MLPFFLLDVGLTLVLGIQVVWTWADTAEIAGCVGNNVAFAMFVGAFSVVASLPLIIQVRMFPHTRTNVAWIQFRKVLVGLLAVLWTIGAFLCTIDGPYTATGNAYFALWLG